jgi:hypothetical protein
MPLSTMLAEDEGHITKHGAQCSESDGKQLLLTSRPTAPVPCLSDYLKALNLHP